MNLEKMQTVAVDQYLRVIETPVRMTAKLFGGQERAQIALLLIARADATVRRTVGRILHNDELEFDATRRMTAAQERERAMHLHAEAERRTAQADDDLAEARQEAEQTRQQVEARTAKQHEQIEQSKRQREQRAAEQEAERARAVREAKAASDKAIDTQAKRARLEQLDVEARALAGRGAAPTTARDAQRAGQAAQAGKSAPQARCPRAREAYRGGGG